MWCTATLLRTQPHFQLLITDSTKASVNICRWAKFISVCSVHSNYPFYCWKLLLSCFGIIMTNLVCSQCSQWNASKLIKYNLCLISCWDFTGGLGDYLQFQKCLTFQTNQQTLFNIILNILIFRQLCFFSICENW